MYSPIGWQVKEKTDELVASLSSILRPTVENQYSMLLSSSADLLRADPNSKILSTPAWSGLLNQNLDLKRALEDRTTQNELSSNPNSQDALRQTPAWQAFIESAVTDEMHRDAPEHVDPKFLVPLD